MAIKRFEQVLEEARMQLDPNVAVAGLEQNEPSEHDLIERVSALIGDYMVEHDGSGVALLGAFRVMWSTTAALAGQVDTIIDRYERGGGGYEQ